MVRTDQKTTSDILTKYPDHEPDRDDPRSRVPLSAHALNALLAVVTAAFLAFVLLPRVPLLETGQIAPRTILAPYTFYIEYEGPGQTTLSFKVTKGELIVAAGERVTERAELVLAELAKQERIPNRLHAYIGLCVLILAFLYLFYRDIRRYRPVLITDRKKILLLLFLMNMTVALTYSARYVLSLAADNLHLDGMTIGFMLPVAAGAMLTTLLLDFHLALGFSFMVSILLGILFQGEPLIPLYFFLGSIVASLSVIQCKKRTALLRAGMRTAMVNVLVIVSVDLFRGELLTRGPSDIAAGIFGAVVMSSVVSASLPFFEAVFDIATDIKLLELLDPNQPLLKELVYKSPGTYHHSILIGNLAESAAEAIGENPTLARVGAYYHDIGKTGKPEYFIENQRPTENKHDHLLPSMSSLIIASHVKEGVELARSHRLPTQIIDIIQQHHGTSLMTYFFQKARELNPAAAVSEEGYRYSGPRPRTKVAAIVMLSDAIEAASRVLDEPSPDRIQALTNTVITRFFLDDQLSMCDLTLQDLRIISKSFNRVLVGIFHHRIDYPGMEIPGEKKRSDHQDKKQSEEKKTVNGGDRGKAREVAADPRHS